METKLSKSSLTADECLQALAGGIAQAVWETDRHGNVESDSPSWRGSTGQSSQEWLAGRWLEMIHLDDRSKVTQAWQNAMIEKKSFKVQCRVKSIAKGWLWTELCAHPIFSKDQVSKWVVISLDISQTKAAEKALEEDLFAMHKLHEVSLEMIVEGDLQKVFDKILQAALELTHSHSTILRIVDSDSGEIRVAAHKGISESYLQSEGIIQNCFARLLDARQNRKRLIIANVLKSQMITEDVRRILIGAGALSAQTTPLVSRSGKVLGFISTHWKKVYVPSAIEMKQLDLLARQAADIIERNESAVALQNSDTRMKAALAEAEAANAAKSIFLARMSHEIRTPMTAIIGFLELLDATPLKSRQQRYLQTVRQNAENLLDIINDILDISKVEAGELTIEEESFDLFATLEDTTALLKIRAAQKQLPLYMNAEGLLPKFVTSDRGRLRQILINLLGNAIKFTDSGRVDLEVWFKERDGSGELHFAVQDTGPGIKGEFLEKIFRPFSQDAQASKKAPGGTGLGLSICKSLVEAMDGKIDFVTQVGRGTTFHFWVPVSEYSSLSRFSAEAQIGELHPSWSATGNVLNQWHVLMVDDTPEMRELGRVFLERSGARVTTANNGREAIEVLHQMVNRGDPPDLVLMDMQMPELDGYEATRIMRSEGFDVPILALTAAAMKGDQEKCLEAGCNGYLSKPLNLRTLQQQVVQFGPGHQALH